METLKPLPIAPASHASILADKRRTLHEYLYNIGEEFRFEQVAPELLKPAEPHYGRTGYTAEQRKWIKTIRDEGMDLAPYIHKTDEERHLHHIWAQAYLQAYLGLANFPELINHPHNGITLSKVAHVGPYIPNVNHSRHPDVHSAKQAYRDNPNLMKIVFEDHWKMAIDGIKYWVDADDSKMFAIATERTKKMRELVERRQNGKK